MTSLNIDPELQPFLDGILSIGLTYDKAGLEMMREGLRSIFGETPPVRPDSVAVQDITIGGPDGNELVLRIYRPKETVVVPALYWMHGGGMVIGSIEMDDSLLSNMVALFGVAAVSVEYRLAPEHPDPAPIEDCYAGLVWTVTHAAEYGIDPNRVAVGGASAGGGLAAGTALLARDRKGPNIAFQLLLEPMLDDRSLTPSSNAYEGNVVWDRKNNHQGWSALLGERIGTDDVSYYAAPARAVDLGGLPPTYIDVGEIETFRDECIDYAQRLMSAGISTEFHVFRGAFHGFDLMALDSGLAKLAWSLRWAALAQALAAPDSE